MISKRRYGGMLIVPVCARGRRCTSARVCLCACLCVHDTQEQPTRHNVHAFVDTRTHRHTAHLVIYSPSAPRHHVCLHAVPSAEGTLVRDMRNVISNSGVAVFLPTEGSWASYCPQEAVVFGC